MAKSKSRRTRRVATVNATRRVLGPTLTTRFGRPSSLGADRRNYSPPSTPTLNNNRRLTKTLFKIPAVILAGSNKRPAIFSQPALNKEVFIVKTPKFSPLCARRAIRKRVLFSKSIAGSGRKMKRPNRNALSNLSCKG